MEEEVWMYRIIIMKGKRVGIVINTGETGLYAYII
jgi:hypothetical protein